MAKVSRSCCSPSKNFCFSENSTLDFCPMAIYLLSGCHGRGGVFSSRWDFRGVRLINENSYQSRSLFIIGLSIAPFC